MATSLFGQLPSCHQALVVFLLDTIYCDLFLFAGMLFGGLCPLTPSAPTWSLRADFLSTFLLRTVLPWAVLF